MTVTLTSTNGAHGADGADGHASNSGQHGNDDYLKVVGSDITFNGKPILLKGASLGGWSEWIPTTCRVSAYPPFPVLMENFMNGFSGHEYQARAELRKTLGQDKYEYYFDKVGRHTCGYFPNPSSSSTTSPSPTRGSSPQSDSTVSGWR
jgi:hypothetical protein